MANLDNERWRQAVEEHIVIIEALEARDADRLAQILKTRLRNKAEVVKLALQDQKHSVTVGGQAAG